MLNLRNCPCHVADTFPKLISFMAHVNFSRKKLRIRPVELKCHSAKEREDFNFSSEQGLPALNAYGVTIRHAEKSNPLVQIPVE